MRDIQRIDRLLQKIKDAWTHYPDIRLLQLITAIVGDWDNFYLEDDELEQKIDLFTNNLNETI